ncbi:hypothetical protein MMPV_006757 [Pyropia vietnamensis]
MPTTPLPPPPTPPLPITPRPLHPPPLSPGPIPPCGGAYSPYCLPTRRSSASASLSTAAAAASAGEREGPAAATAPPPRRPPPPRSPDRRLRPRSVAAGVAPAALSAVVTGRPPPAPSTAPTTAAAATRRSASSQHLLHALLGEHDGDHGGGSDRHGDGRSRGGSGGGATAEAGPPGGGGWGQGWGRLPAHAPPPLAAIGGGSAPWGWPPPRAGSMDSGFSLQPAAADVRAAATPSRAPPPPPLHSEVFRSFDELVHGDPPPPHAAPSPGGGWDARAAAAWGSPPAVVAAPVGAAIDVAGVGGTVGRSDARPGCGGAAAAARWPSQYGAPPRAASIPLPQPLPPSRWRVWARLVAALGSARKRGYAAAPPSSSSPLEAAASTLGGAAPPPLPSAPRVTAWGLLRAMRRAAAAATRVPPPVLRLVGLWQAAAAAVRPPTLPALRPADAALAAMLAMLTVALVATASLDDGGVATAVADRGGGRWDAAVATAAAAAAAAVASEWRSPGGAAAPGDVDPLPASVLAAAYPHPLSLVAAVAGGALRSAPPPFLQSGALPPITPGYATVRAGTSPWAGTGGAVDEVFVLSLPGCSAPAAEWAVRAAAAGLSHPPPTRIAVRPGADVDLSAPPLPLAPSVVAGLAATSAAGRAAARRSVALAAAHARGVWAAAATRRRRRVLVMDEGLWPTAKARRCLAGGLLDAIDAASVAAGVPVGAGAYILSAAGVELLSAAGGVYRGPVDVALGALIHERGECGAKRMWGG